MLGAGAGLGGDVEAGLGVAGRASAVELGAAEAGAGFRR